MDEVTDLRALGRHVADQEDAALRDTDADEELRRRLAERAATRVQRLSSRRRWRLGAAAIATLSAAAAAVAFRVDAFSRTLTFVVAEPPRPGVVQEWVSAEAGRKLPVRFSDGSRITLEPGARGRVVSVASHGAEFVIESGRASVTVVPDQRGDYRVRTGPFVVHVHGTRFTVEWDPVRDAFSLSLYEGHVTVSGCVFGSGRAVEPGESVRASCADPSVRVEKAATPAVSASAVSSPAATAPAAPAPVTRTEGRVPDRMDPTPVERQSWIELARAGLYDRAYAAATAEGFARQREARDPDHVFLLGDVARHAGHVSEAVSAYTAARERFPGSEAAANAAFALGRVAFDGNRDHGAAAAWFEKYLAERPRGQLASTALGRLLEARVALGQSAQARSIAGRYVALYPNGPLANEARKILRSSE